MYFNEKKSYTIRKSKNVLNGMVKKGVKEMPIAMENSERIPRILNKPLESSKSFFLLGPRGTGKTWWIQANLKDAIYIDLLKTDLYVSLLAEPNRLEHLIPPSFENWVVIDEVQRIPMLLNEVHRLIEGRHYKFVLTGSSARNLRKQGVNLLAGRALNYKMYPFTALELKDRFNLERSLKYGHLPAVFSEPDPKAYLNAYVNTYLREEVLQEGLTRNISAFVRFLEVASFSQGSVLNMAAIARESGIHQKVVAAYFDILDDLLLSIKLPVFSKRVKRRIVSHPKFYLFDIGVYKTLRPRGFLDSTPEIDGAGLETLFLQELRAVNDYLQLGYELYYWRTQTGIEVDFVAYGLKKLFAFEIKMSAKVNRKDCKGLRTFKEEYPSAELYLFYMGDTRYYYDDVTVLPIVEALKTLPELLA